MRVIKNGKKERRAVKLTLKDVAKNRVLAYLRLLELKPSQIAEDFGYNKEFVLEILTELIREDKIKVTI